MVRKELIDEIQQRIGKQKCYNGNYIIGGNIFGKISHNRWNSFKRRSNNKWSKERSSSNFASYSFDKWSMHN